MSGASSLVVSCGFGLSEVGVREIRKPQVAGSIPVAGSRSRSDLEPHQVLREQGHSLSFTLDAYARFQKPV